MRLRIISESVVEHGDILSGQSYLGFLGTSYNFAGMNNQLAGLIFCPPSYERGLLLSSDALTANALTDLRFQLEASSLESGTCIAQQIHSINQHDDNRRARQSFGRVIRLTVHFLRRMVREGVSSSTHRTFSDAVEKSTNRPHFDLKTSIRQFRPLCSPSLQIVRRCRAESAFLLRSQLDDGALLLHACK